MRVHTLCLCDHHGHIGVNTENIQDKNKHPIVWSVLSYDASSAVLSSTIEIVMIRVVPEYSISRTEQALTDRQESKIRQTWDARIPFAMGQKVCAVSLVRACDPAFPWREKW